MADRVTSWRGYRAYLTRPHDGDSFWVMVDTGFDQRAEPELRLFDVHAPELIMRLPSRGQTGGTETTDFVNDWMAAAEAAQPIRRFYLSVGVAMTAKVEPVEQVTFRRYVAEVFRYNAWPEPWLMPPPPHPETVSLNHAVSLFLAAHPDWPTGK